jgi:hypothetical protein
MRRATSAATAALVLVLAVAGCDGDASPPAASAAATTTGTTTGTTAAAAATTSTAAPTTASRSTAAPAPCTASVFLPILKRRLDGSSPKLRIVRAEVRRCRNGYAQVFAVPDQSVCEPGVGYCYETEQVFLGWSDGSWRVLITGTGITCEGETNAQVRRICQALGYPG